MPKIQQDHAALVKALCKPGQDIIQSLTPEMAHAWHMATGISGEAGETLDAVKKFAIYCKPIDLRNIIEELGDLEFYMEGLRSALGITREQCLEQNIAKLSKRYASGSFSNEEAQNRADKDDKTDGVVFISGNTDLWYSPEEACNLLPGNWSINGDYIENKNDHGAVIASRYIFNGTEHHLAQKGKVCLLQSDVDKIRKPSRNFIGMNKEK